MAAGLCLLIHIHERLARYDEAVGERIRAVYEDPAGDIVRAEKTIDAALALQPDNSAAHEASGFRHFTKHQWPQAIAEEGGSRERLQQPG